MVADDELLAGEGVPGEQQPARPPQDPFISIFGRHPLNLPELLRRLDRASWPAEVVVSAPDFIALARFGGPVARDQDDRAFFWIANTKVLCHKPTQTLLDLTQYDGIPDKVVVPSPGAWAYQRRPHL